MYIVKEERLEYGQRVFMAKRRPDLYMSITIDGSDNSSYGFPYFSQKGHQDQKVSDAYKIPPFFFNVIKTCLTEVQAVWAVAF